MSEDKGMNRPYQGKDIVSKILTNTFREKTFAVYGVKDVPAIKAYLPTELPTIEASDRISDHVFLLEDDSYAIVDYESAYKSENKIKYLEYATRLAKHYFKPGQSLKIRIIVIYTCDVESANDTFNVGAITLKVEQAFLSKIDGNAELSKIKEKINNGEKLTDEDLMRLAVLPLTKKGRKAKEKMIDEVIDTAEMMQKTDDAGTSFVLSAMYVAAGNFITAGQEDRIKEVLDMTALGKGYEQEKKQYADYRVAKVYVDLVDRKIQEKGLSEKEACAQVGITTETYEMARAVVESNKEVEAV